MISKTIKSIAMVAIVFATLNFVSCKRDNDNTVEDAQAAAVAEQFVDNTVAPTYTALAAKAEQLASQLAALKANPTNAGVREACETFLAAREQWEMSEAFLFGAAGDFGIDPHIDSWPLDEDAFNTLMNSPAMIEALDSEDGDAVAGDRLGNALLGFHGIEYILFANGQPKDVSNITANQWIYVVAVAGDLRNRCYQLEVGWIMKNAGKAGSTYSSRTAALMAILQGCSDIADEVGSSKIYAAWHGEDITYIESPYSQKSIIDFHDNIVSIRNAYMGGVEGKRDESKSLHNYVNKINASLDARVLNAIDNALAKIDAMPAPFVLHYSDAANGEAVDACSALSDVLGEAIIAIRNE